MSAELADHRIHRLVGAREASNASNTIRGAKLGTFADQRIEIGCIDTDCLGPFGRNIVVLNWISGQRNWMKIKTLGRLDVPQAITP
ncbi:hypothetical protein A9174_32220 [Mesorhizobium loti NZP2037]|nr:hypothetical protein A9174_32220 [Mesorhizobium loti NZP2037]OBP77965.1 hypothetical protein BAE41_30910 [Mesorhizobium loti]